MRQGGRYITHQKPRRVRWIARSAVVLGVLLAIPSPSLAATSRVPAAKAAPAASFAVVRGADGHIEVVRGGPTARSVGDPKTATVPEGEVLTSEADTVVTGLGTGGDPLRGYQWALDRVPYETAWASTKGRGVIVAVIDTGVRADHEDLAGAVLSGLDLVGGGGDGRTDPNGHGTHVAGIIAARDGNGKGIAGAAPEVQILPVRVLDANGAGFTSDVAEGIIWASEHGARIINLSLGGTAASEGMREAIKYALSKGALVFAAAGNSGESGSPAIYPAAFPETVAVGAVRSNLERAPYSNVGSYVDVVAPGDSIISTYQSGDLQYASESGTSMATPYAAAVGALIAAANPAWGAAAVRSRLEETALDLGPAGPDPQYGKGLVEPAPAAGYWVVGADGRVSSHGGARHYGDLAGTAPAAPIVSSAATVSGRGYWLAGSDGGVFTFGDAPYYGSMAGRRLNAPIVGMAVTPTGGGYFLLGADGGIFSFGDARFHGSTGGMTLNAPVLDMTVSASGDGYWLVAADGGVFTFGSATFKGSTGGMRLNSPAASMTSAADGSGYWVVARDGGIFAFGVQFQGSLPGIRVSTTAGVRIRAVANAAGYYILTADGQVYPFGDARGYAATTSLSVGAAVDLMLVP